jgi:hypothetical protein
MQRLIGTELPLRPDDQCCYRTADKRDELATLQLIKLTLLGHQLADGGDASRKTPPARALLASSRRALFCPARGRWEGLIRKGVSRVSTQRPWKIKTHRDMVLSPTKMSRTLTAQARWRVKRSIETGGAS